MYFSGRISDGAGAISNQYLSLPTPSASRKHMKEDMKECIFVRDGIITEGSRSNIFIISDGTLYTHPESDFILSGVTRKNILQVCKRVGIDVREEPFPEKDLGRIQEAFISNTSAEVTPVTFFDTMQVGNGMPGPITSEIHKKFQAEIIALNG